MDLLLAETSPFVVGRVYRRRWLHDAYGGQRQGGISTPVRSLVVFLFTGDSGHQYGYNDGFQEDGIFWYTGEGQKGNMQLKAGNLAIVNHEKESKDLHIFAASGKGFVRYLGNASYLGHHIEAAPDRDNNPRQVIVFELAVDDESQGEPLNEISAPPLKTKSRFWFEPLETLRQRALQRPTPSSTRAERRSIAYQRSEAVKVYVLRRAGDICEGCEQAAPFKKPDGRGYLEPHHIRRLADAGPDHPRWMAALCPNCHRRVHHGIDGAAFNELLATHIGTIDGELTDSHSFVGK